MTVSAMDALRYMTSWFQGSRGNLPCSHTETSRDLSCCTYIKKGREMNYTIETEQEEDGRWIAEVIEISGVMKYGATREEAIAQAEALALRVIAEQIEAGEQIVAPIQITFAAA